MAKTFKISFRVKSAEKVAESLGVSNTRKDRIFRIVKKNTPKSKSSRITWTTKGKSESRAVGKNTNLTLRTRQQSDAQASS